MWKLNNTKPKAVQKAVIILYGTFFLGVMRLPMEFPKMVEKSAAIGGVWFVFFTQLLVFFFLLLLVSLIERRKNWARYIFIALTILGIPYSIKPMSDLLANEPISGVLLLIQSAAQVIAVIFLFQAPAREWFSKRAK